MKVVYDVNINFHSTPQLWIATREGYEPGGLYGQGKTEVAALADLLERELEAEPSD